MTRFVWGGYVLAVLWMGLVFFYANQRLAERAKSHFREEGRRLVSLWADRLTDSLDRPEKSLKTLRRFSGEPDSYSVALLDLQGDVKQSFGGTSDPPPSPKSEPLDQKETTSPPSWAFWAPVWKDGLRYGTLYWSRDARPLQNRIAQIRQALGVAWAWGAVAGALGSFLFLRKALNLKTEVEPF